MILLEDTRNPISKHRNIHDYCQAAGIHIERTKLYVGDYTLPTDQSICIDTKSGLQEVYSNVIGDSARFKRELARAMASNIRIVILVEEPGIENLYDVVEWANPRIARWKKNHEAHANGKMANIKINGGPPKSSATLAAKMSGLTRLYGVEWRFCDKTRTGKIICDILAEGSV